MTPMAAIFGAPPAWLTGLFPAPLTYSPAMLILIFPLAFRLSCYHSRVSFFNASLADPPHCSVGVPRNK